MPACIASTVTQYLDDVRYRNMSEEQRGGNRNIRPLILSSVISSGTGSSSSPFSSLQVTGQAAASAAQGISLQPQAETDRENDQSDTVNPTCTPFVQQVQANPTYGSMVHSVSEYEVRLVHGKKQLHWFLLVKMFRSKLPYLTLEISTTDLCDLIPILRSVACENNENSKPQVEDPLSATCITDAGTYKGTLYDLCRLADKVVQEMKKYNLVTSNCQHFCNNLLRKIGMKMYPTTIGRMTSEIKEKRFDYYYNVISSDVPDLA